MKIHNAPRPRLNSLSFDESDTHSLSYLNNHDSFLRKSRKTYHKGSFGEENDEYAKTGWWYNYVFVPESPPKLVWNLILLLIIIYQALSVPYTLAFRI